MASFERVLIVGGGIAGLTLSAALRRLGIEPELVEQAPEWKPVGAGITLGVNAVRLLARMGLEEALEARSYVVPKLVLTDADGRELLWIDLAQIAQEHGKSLAVHRAALHEVLLSANEHAHIRLGTTVDSLAANGEFVEVTFSDGSAGRYDLVVGADGIRSKTRALVFGTNPVHYSGYTCWRFVVPLTVELPGPVEMWGRGKRFGLVPIGGELLYCFTTTNAPPGEPDPLEGRLERFKQRYAEFGGAVPRVLEELNDPLSLVHNDLEEVRQRPWTHGRVVLIGDAAHAMTPNMGQGASMAIEDAAVLAEELPRGESVPAALAAWEARRYRRASWVRRRSWRFGKVAQWQSALACRVRNRLFRVFYSQRRALADYTRLVTGEP